MTNEERDLITGLFNRLRSADNPQKDREAETLIQQATAAQPSAPYLLVQTVLVQEHALSNAQARIQQLERQLADDGAGQSGGGGGVGSFLAGLLGGHSSQGSSGAQARPAQTPPPMPAQNYAQPAPTPYPSTVNMPPSAGGGFLRSALGTAAGVAGGAVLFQGIQNLLGHNAGPFGGGGSGFFGGGGGYGGSELIENREVVNNYYDERGNRDEGSGSGSFLGGGGGGDQEQVGFNPGQQHEDNRYDSGNSGDTDGDGPLYSTPPTDDPVDSGALDNTYDSGNTDASGFDSGGGGGNEDTSYV